MQEWIGLIGALAGTGIGGLVTYKVAAQRHAHERKIEADRKLIVACESIHELLSKISSQASSLNLGVIGHHGFNRPFNAKDSVSEKVELDRLRMLVDFYAPEVTKRR